MPGQGYSSDSGSGSGSSGGYGSYYGAVKDYFSQSGGNKSEGKAGGTGGGASLNSRASQTSGTGSSGDATQGGNASSGSAWISAAVSQTSSDKSFFSTPFSQNFGGISNNQIMNSPNATGATNVQPYNASGNAPGLGGASPVPVMLMTFAGVALILYTLRHR